MAPSSSNNNNKYIGKRHSPGHLDLDTWIVPGQIPTGKQDYTPEYSIIPSMILGVKRRSGLLLLSLYCDKQSDKPGILLITTMIVILIIPVIPVIIKGHSHRKCMPPTSNKSKSKGWHHLCSALF